MHNIKAHWIARPPFEILANDRNNLNFSVEVNSTFGRHMDAPDIDCTAFAKLSSFGSVVGNVLLDGFTTVTASNGRADFYLTLRAPAAANVNLTVSCSYGESPAKHLPLLTHDILTKIMRVEWAHEPPSYIIPSSTSWRGAKSTTSAGKLMPIAKAIKIRLADSANNTIETDNTTLCKLAVSDTNSSATATLLSSAEQSMEKGFGLQ